jgi:hypothetical protein
MKKAIILCLLFALSNLSCGIIGLSTLTIHNNSGAPVTITCSYTWESEEDEYGHTETYYEYWTMSLANGESGEETIYGDTGTYISVSARQGTKTANFSYTVSINGNKTISIDASDF